MDSLPKVDTTAHAGSSKVPENVRETPLYESSVPLAEVTDPLKLPTEVAPEVTYTKPTETKPEQSNKKIGLIGKISIGVTGLLLAGAVGAGIGIGTASQDQGENPNKPPEKSPDDTSQVEEEIEIPAEAQDYVTVYGDRYLDPLATYYAEKAYTEEHGVGATVTQSYFDEYDFEANKTFFNGEVSPLGFTPLRWELNKEVTDENFLNFFNESMAPAINNTLSLLAKNPTSEGIEVLRHEFTNHTGLESGDYANNLFNALLSVSTEYGSNSNYEVNPAVIDFAASDQEFSIYDGGLVPIDSVDENGNTVDFSDSMDISIDVQSYNNKGEVTSSVAVIEDLQLTVTRVQGLDFGDLGRVGIGSK